MIHLESLSKVYATAKGDVRALDNVSLTVSPGEFVAVRGPSGCGKSTLLALTGGLAQPTSGRVVVAGDDLGKMSSADLAAFRARHIGFVFQMFHLLPYLNVRDNVLVAAPPGEADKVRRRADALLDAFGLGDRLTHRPAELSAGQRQRVAMARALLNEPSLILADEPTGNLDQESARPVMELLTSFHRDGGTILLVTHDEHSAGYAGRTVLLDQGRLQNGKG